jgi:hypothetical protein
VLTRPHSGPQGPDISQTDHGGLAPSMDVDSPSEEKMWTVDPVIHAAVHRDTKCQPCRAYREHLFSVLLDGKEGLTRVLEELRKVKEEKAGADAEKRLLEEKLDRAEGAFAACNRDFKEMRTQWRDTEERVKSLEGELQALEEENGAMRGRKHVRTRQEERGGFESTDTPGSSALSVEEPRGEPSRVRKPVGPTHGHGEDVLMEDQFPPLPVPREPAGGMGRPPSFAAATMTPASMRVGPTGRPVMPTKGPAPPTAPSTM